MVWARAIMRYLKANRVHPSPNALTNVTVDGTHVKPKPGGGGTVAQDTSDARWQ